MLQASNGTKKSKQKLRKDSHTLHQKLSGKVKKKSTNTIQLKKKILQHKPHIKNTVVAKNKSAVSSYKDFNTQSKPAKKKEKKLKRGNKSIKKFQSKAEGTAQQTENHAPKKTSVRNNIITNNESTSSVAKNNNTTRSMSSISSIPHEYVPVDQNLKTPTQTSVHNKIKQGKQQKYYQKLRGILQNKSDSIEQTNNKVSKRTKPTTLREKMMEKLKAAKFRYINEQMYTSNGKDAQRYFQNNSAEFEAYHDGYKQQVRRWPVNPLSVIIKSVEKLYVNVSYVKNLKYNPVNLQTRNSCRGRFWMWRCGTFKICETESPFI